VIGAVPTWRELSLDSLLAAQVLLAAGHLRSSVSRSYYAAYCAISSELARRGVSFARGWANPSHEQLPALVRNALVLSPNTRRQLNQAIRRLRTARENADYRPGVLVDRADAIAAVRDALMIVQALERSV
jgi:uncharacterized protein (UPF0332 family)